jgi:hypothetical protein
MSQLGQSAELAVAMPRDCRAANDRSVAVSTDRAFRPSRRWRVQRAGVRGGVGRTETKALLPLALAAGRVASGVGQSGALRDADRWLQNALQRVCEPVLAAEVVRAARAAQNVPTALRRASVRLDVIRAKVGMRDGWGWSLPPDGERVPGAVANEGEGDQAEIQKRAGAAGGRS